MGSGSHSSTVAWHWDRTLANPGRTSLHSQPATNITQVESGAEARAEAVAGAGAGAGKYSVWVWA